MTSSRTLRRVVFSGVLFALLPEGVALGQDAVPPHLIESVTPEFPADASADEGHVVLALSLDDTGAVTDVTVLTSGGGAFDAAALAVARRLRFEPARRGDLAVAARIPFTFDFERPAAPAPAVQASITPEPAIAPSPAKPVAKTAPATEATADEPEELDVRGERPPREPTVHVLTGEEIRKTPGTNGDLLRAVENLPGVGRPAGLDGALLIRGSSPAESGAFLDGTWIINAYHFGGVTSVVPPELVERLEFHPGNFSPEYGRLMGGIVELELKSPRKDHLGGVLQVDLLDARTVVEGPISKTTRFAVGARRSWIDAWIGAAAGKAIVAAPVYYDYQGILEHDFSRSVTGRVEVFGSDDRTKLLFDSPDAQDPSSGGNLSLREGFVRVGGRLDARLSDSVRWVNKISWGPNDQGFSLGEMRVTSRFNVLTGRSDLRARLGDGVALVLGADVLWGGYDVTLKIPPVDPDAQNQGPLFARPLAESHGKGNVSRPAGYALLELRPFHRLLFTPGVRVDYMSDTGRWTADPRVAVRFDLSEGPNRTTLKGAAGSFRQAPDPAESMPPFGTPGIRSAWAEHYALGMEQVFGGKVELSVEGFAKRFNELIVATTDEAATQTGVTHANTGSGRSFGVEWLVKYTGKSRFQGFLAYTLSRSERRDQPSEAYHLFSYDQTHILSAVGSYDLGRGWSVGSRFRYVTGVPYTPYVGSVVDYDAGAYAPIRSPLLGSARVGAFHRLDVRVEKTWDLRPVRLSAYLDVQNVYNHQSEEGRAYSFDYSKSSALGGLPILPILGVRGEL